MNHKNSKYADKHPLNLLSLQANKRQQLLERQAVEQADDAGASASDDSSEEEEHDQLPNAATSLITDLGAAPASNDKYRDENFYLGYDRGDNRYAEEGFAVGGRGQDMVLDLAGDENVSQAGIHPDACNRGNLVVPPERRSARMLLCQLLEYVSGLVWFDHKAQMCCTA